MREEIAWLAGLFEGEGWITFPKNSPHGVTLGLKMTDEDVVRRAQSITGLGSVTHRKRTEDPKYKDVWTWTVGSKEQVQELIALLLPWMGERRSKRMEEALIRLEGNRGYNLEIEHGTLKGYRAEQRRKIPFCGPCREANSAYNRSLYGRKARNENSS